MSLDIHLPNFDVLMSLYKENPEAFEEFHKHVLQEAVERTPPKQRPALDLILKQIEAAHGAASSPIEATLLAFKLMQESLVQLQGSWEETQYALAELNTSLVIERVRKCSS